MKTPPRRVRSRRGGKGKSSVAGAEGNTSPNRPLSTLALDDLRQVYWSLTRQGHRLPAQPGIILIDGGAVAGAIATQPPPPGSGLRPIGPIITATVRDLARQRAATAT